MTMSNLVELSIADSVAVLALNRPEVRNAINDAMRGELFAAIERAAADDAITALVLTGNGKSFSSGGDISGMRERLKAPQGKVAFNGWRRPGQIHRAVAALHGFPKPTIPAGERWARRRSPGQHSRWGRAGRRGWGAISRSPATSSSPRKTRRSQ